MSVSLNSINDSTSTEATEEVPEEIADLSLNQDEVLDLEMALGALGGLRHSRACDAAELSTRRFDERQHRLHEARMKKLGMEGEEKEPDEEPEDMSQQVLIRSPINHHYHYPAAPNGNQPTPQPAPQTPAQPAEPGEPTGLSNLAKAAIVAAALLGTGGAAAGLYAFFNQGGDTTINQLEDTQTGLGLVPPGPPKSKEGSP